MPILALLASVPAAGDITKASLEIQGIGLSVVQQEPPVTTPIDVPTTVQTKFGGKQNDEALAIEGLLAVGDLTGPGLDAPLELSTAPGHKFEIPGLSREGVYTLQNVRLMKGRELLQYATPSSATIIVADLFQTAVEVRQLSPEEIRARGIVIDARNFEVYEYTLSFLIRGETVKIPFPVIIDPRTRAVQMMPIIDPYRLPAINTIGVGRWTPPDVVPIVFENDELPPDERPTPKPPLEPGEKLYKRPPIPAAIVIPNSLAVMHQFFAVVLSVQNGAPTGSTAKLENLSARIKVPSQLRTASSIPAVSLGQAVPIVDKVNGLTILVAQAKGEAEWSVEALKPGTHTIEIELKATLKENGQEDVPLVARPRASVVVHDARFNIAFSHPDVVRKNIEYTTYSFVTNTSPVTQTIRLGNSVPPCATAANANVCRIDGGLSDEITIPSGETRIVEYRLRSGVTGKVFATAAHIDSENAVATAQLHMGVSDTGVPLSPATLIMPHYAQYVNEALVSEYLQILGLGYSLATSSLTPATAKLPRVIKSDVYRRAVDIAQAGQAIFLANGAEGAEFGALAGMSIDLLGNQAELSQWDTLRRQEKYARFAGAAVTRELERTGLKNSATLETFTDNFGKAMSHRDGYVAALVHGAATQAHARPYALSIRGATSGRRIDIPAEAESGWIRDLPYAELTQINAPQIGRQGELALVGRWTTEDLEVIVTPNVSGPFRLELLFPNTTDGSTMRAHFDTMGTVGEPLRIPLSRGMTTVNALMLNGGIGATTSAAAVPLELLRVVGIRQDLYLDENGHKVSVLFNRPVAAGVEPKFLRDKFHGEIDFNKDGVVWLDQPRPISGAALQQSARVIDLTFDHVLTTNASYTIEIDPLLDPRLNAPASFPGEHAPKIDNDAPAGIIYGKFVRGDNTPLAQHEVILFAGIPDPEKRGGIFEEFENPRRRVPINPYIQPPQIATTRDDGSYLFEFVRRDLEAGFSGSFRMWGLADGLTKYTYVDGTVRLPGRVHPVTLQLLGRGTAEGVVRYDNGEIAKNANVTVGSTAFEGVRSAVTNDAGFYRVEDLPVGPLAFTATDAAGNIGYAAGEIATPGEIEQQDISIYRQPVPKNGSVHGVVRRSDTGAPVFGASVGAFNNGYPLGVVQTDSDGRYSFEKVPAGFISIVAAEWTISRQSANTDFDLRGDEVRQVDFTLSVTPNEPLATVTGQVLREDPLFPGNASKYQKVAGALVKIYGMRIVTTDAEGRFEVANVPLTRSGYEIAAYDPATRRTERTVLPILTTAGPNNIPILLRGLGKGKIRAKLLDARGASVNGCEMLVKQGGAYYVMSEVGDGVYELDKLDVGAEYIVRTGAVPGHYGKQEAVSNPIRVAFDGQIASVSLRLPGQGNVHARVKGISIPSNGGEPILTSLISEVTLRYRYFDSGTLQTEEEEITLSTNNNGLPGDAVFPNIPAMRDYSVASDHPLGQSNAGGRLAFEGDLGDHTLLLSNLGHITGVVYGIDGTTPVPNAQVRLEDGHQDQGIVTAGLDGKFEFRNVAPNTGFRVVAESTQAGIFRTGERYGSIPPNGGIVNTSITLIERGQIEGKVVYAAYKVYDPLRPENNVADNTPGDPSDNAPVPMARLYMRELDFPRRDLGTPTQPLNADLGGRFAIDNVFVGRLRATAWSPDNPDLRGDWTATLVREGELLTPYITIGGGGTGALVATVTNPNAQNAVVENAEVQLFRGGLFDFASTGVDGKVRFEQLPVGHYTVAAYSKALGKSGRATGTIEVTVDGVAEARIMLTFSGQVTGRLTDPESSPAYSPVPGSHVTIQMAEGFQQRFTTTGAGEYLFEGVREGMFWLDAKDTTSNRRAKASGLLSAADPAPVVNLELERTETLHLGMYLPDDFGANSNVLAGPVEATVTQRSGDFYRSMQGNPIEMPKLFLNEGYQIHIQELGGERRVIDTFGSFPKGNSANPIKITYPAYGSLEVYVRRGTAPVADARVSVRVSRYDTRVFYTDSSGHIIAHGLPLNGEYSITATTLDGSSGSTSVKVLRTSVVATGNIEVGSRATLTGRVIAEAGGPSAGTPVVISFSGGQLSGTTDDQGYYTFAGVATTPGASPVTLFYYGPDGNTLGAKQSFPLGNEWAGRDDYPVPTVRIDATPPVLMNIVPEQGAGNVPPDTHLKFVFSEQIDAATINNDHFVLQPADGSARVHATFLSTAGANNTWIVTMVPPAAPAGQQFPLKSNTLYRLTVSQLVRDMTGHAVGTNRGLTFTTADYVEPRVVSTVPEAGTPIPEQITYEFRFNEPLDPAPFNTGGSGRVELARMSDREKTATVLEVITGNAYIDPFTGISLFFAPNQNTKPNSFYRIKFSGVRDLQGNIVPEQTYRYASYDTFKPFVILTSPVPDGNALVSGLTYKLTPDIRNATADGTPAQDVDRVEYFRVENNFETFIKAVKKAPFAYEFVAPDAPAAGLPLVFRAKAWDSSVNESEMVTLELTVKPNQPPTVAVVLDRTADVYAGERVNATVTTTDEVLDINLQLDFKATRTDGSQYRKVDPKTVHRDKLTDPWPTATFPIDLPTNLQGGTIATFTAIATDMSGLSNNATASLTLAVDSTQPTIVSTTPDAGTEFSFGQTYRVTANVTDIGSGVSEVIFNVDGVAHAVPRSASLDGTYTSPLITVTAHSVNTTVPITVTAVDYSNNRREQTFDVIYLSIDDPTVPSGEWLCPISNAVLPANASNFPLKLRFYATDDVSVTSVKFRLPGVETLVTPASDKPNEYAATVTINTPSPETTDSFITAIVTDADPSHTQEFRLRLSFVTPDVTINSTQAIIADNIGIYQDKTVLVTGVEGRLVPHVPVRLKNLLVLDGGRVDTLPTTTSIERRLDLTITNNLYIDCASSVDVTARGYLASYQANGDGSGTSNNSDRGRTSGNTIDGGARLAGGSHGGSGDSRGDGVTNNTYGSYTEPRTLGAGGGGNPGFGGAGGGAAAITGAENSRFVIAGGIRADGATGHAHMNSGAGAGGSVLLRAQDVIIGRSGRVTANGGDQVSGGGGRVAIYATRTLNMPDNTVQARGGRHAGHETVDHLDGGAGTIYIARPGDVENEHELRITSFDDRYPATIHQTHGTPIGIGSGSELVFRNITVGPHALLRIDSPYRVTQADGVSVDATSLLVGPEDQPLLNFTTTPAAAATVWQNAPISFTYDAAADDGIGEVRVITPGAVDRIEGSYTWPATVGPRTINLNIPPTAQPGPVTLKIRALTRSFRTVEKTVTFDVASDAAPQVVFENVTPDTDIYAGGTIVVNASASDDLDVKSLTLATSAGSVSSAAAVEPTPQTMTRQFSVVVPKTQPSGTSVVLTLSASDGFPSRPPTTKQHSILVRRDEVAPQVTVVRPSPNQELNEVSNGTFTIEVHATDAAVGVNTVVATFEGTNYPMQAVAGNPGRYAVSVPIPQVEGLVPVAKTISIAVTDFEPNTTPSSLTIYIVPLTDPNAPKMAWVCSSPNAMYPAGMAVPLRLSAVGSSTQNGVQRVELSINGAAPAAMASAGTNLYQTNFTIPVGTPAGTVFNLRASAFSTSGAEAALISSFKVVAGTQIASAYTISATDLSLDNGTIIVQSNGVLTITGPHTFANLVVLDNGRVIQKHRDINSADTITVQSLYVACNGAIDVTGSGYLQGASYPGARLPGSQGGGSHIGQGGLWEQPVASSFGSIYRPLEPGGGGGNPNLNSGPGGGVVRIAANAVTLDGAIRANGVNSQWDGGGAGGSVWLTTNIIGGAGAIDANGGTAAGGSGGGGAIAIEYSDGASKLPVLRAATNTSTHAHARGGAGSIYVKGPQSLYGDVSFNNNGYVGQPTDLPAFGIATVDSVPSAGTIVLRAPATVAPHFAGHWLRVYAPDGTERGTWRISIVANTTRVVLENPSTITTIQPGDTVRGAYRFDRMTLTGAKVQTADLVILENAASIDATSSLVTGNVAPPPIDLTKISFVKGVGGPLLVGAPGAVSDPDQPIEMIVRNTAREPAAPVMNANLVTFGTVGGFSVRKVSNGQQWGSAMGTRASTHSAYISCRASQTNIQTDCALLSANSARNYAIGMFNNSTWQIWVHNSPTSVTGGYTTNTTFRIERTPGTTRWFVDGKKVHEVSADGTPLFPYVSVRHDGGEVNSVHFSVDTNLSSRGYATSDGSFSLAVEGLAGDPVLLTARDGHVFPMETADVAVGSIPADFGVASVSLAPNPVTGGRTSIGTVTLASAAGAGGATIVLYSNNAAATVPQTVGIAAGQISAPFNVTTTAVTGPTDVAISAAWGASSASATLSIAKDLNLPTITVTSPVANAQYNEGATVFIPVQATVVDEDSGVKRVFATFNSQTYELPRDTAKGANVYYTQVPAPFVDGTQPVPFDVVVSAVDNTDNIAAAPAVQVLIKPVVEGGIPSISWVCSSGATYPVGYPAKLRVLAKAPIAANPIHKVDFVIDGTSYAATSVGGDAYELTWTVPAVASGTTFNVNAIGTTAAGTTNNVTGWVTAIVADQTFTANATIAATDLQFENKVIVVTGGTLTIAGAHTFQHLAVLGGNVTHPVVDNNGDGGLDVRVTGDLYVACNATIDVSGRGFGPGKMFPGIPPTGNATGGAHIGWGGHWEGAQSEPYGSIYRPLEPGGSSSHGGWGGGVVRIIAANIGIDGVIRSNGLYTDSAGAGGSVYLTGGRVNGAGRIEANGGDGYWGSGGGGAIAIEYTDPASILPVRQAAAGPSHGHNRLGGAGAIYTRGAGATYGDLFIDGEDRVHQWSGLSSLGTGTAAAGSSGATLVTGRTSIQRYFRGHWVQISTPAGVVKGIWRVESISGGTITFETGATVPDVAVGDTFKGVYRFDNVTMRRIVLHSPDPIITSNDQVIEGNVYVQGIAAKNLIVKGSLLGPPHTLTPMTIDIENELRVETGGRLDLSGRGFAPGTTYANTGGSGNATGGSHMGYGGIWDGPFGATYGSVYRPQELGAGSTHGGWGGGALRINAPKIVVNGAIRVNGAHTDSAGAGGSLWIKAGHISGTGTIEANGGDGYWGSGGGGAIAIEYTDPSTQLPVLHATSGPSHGHNRLGGAGTMYIFHPTSTYGDLIVDGENRVHQKTELPALGNGTAQDGSSGATLVTARSQNIPTYFIGHWVEIYDASGALEGTWRVATINAKTVTLRPNGNETISVDQGDRWQGVYRFDTVDFRGVVVDSADPIRVVGTQIVKGVVVTERVTAANLHIVSGGTLTHHMGGSLTVNVDGELRIDAGGSIDVSGRGYSPGVTHPTASPAGNASGGSHIGVGGQWELPLGTTYGSVYRPQERGAGSTHHGWGGGLIRINATNLVVNGAIRANGQSNDGAGAGGSVWITVGKISGTGGIETNGGSGYWGTGAGGALAIEYTDPTSVIPGTGSAGGSSHGHNRLAGPGTQYFKGPNHTYGDLLIHGASRAHQFTRLPSLGNGVAQFGSSGPVLVTDRTTNIPDFFVGHWIEISSPAGTLRGTWRVMAIDQKTVTLAPNANETITISQGDKWQGVYRFDKVTMAGDVYFDSPDPVRSTEHLIQNTVSAEHITADKLLIAGTLTHPWAPGKTLTIEATSEVRVTGTIDVSGRGYAPGTSYPNTRLSGHASGATHFGRGGIWENPLGAAYGSVHRPQEPGAGSTHHGWGGGVIRIKTANLIVDGPIRANGQANDAGGAGGSIWITAGKISGSSGIETNGGSGYWGTGGGGALAIEYADPTSVIPGIGSAGGSSHGHNRLAGPGTQFYFRPTSILGDLYVDGANRAHQACELPSLGIGSAMNGSGEATIVTDRASIAPYFVGHWVEVSTVSGTVKGMWRLAKINGSTITLAPNANESIPVAAGDTWRGLYRFDNLKLRTATLTSADQILITNPIDKDASSSVVVNSGPPQFPAAKRSQIVVVSALTGDAVTGPFGAVTDDDLPVKLTVTNTRTSLKFTANANADGSFRVPVDGVPGDTFTIVAEDSHAVPLSSPSFAINGSIVETNSIATFAVDPSTVAGGTTTYGVVRLAGAARAAGATIALSSSNGIASVPASIVVKGGLATAQFPITTSSPAATTPVQLTASIGSSSANATFTITSSSSSAIADLVLSSSTVEGGTSITGTVILGAPAPAGGAVVMLNSSVPQAGVQSTIVIGEGETQAAFTITTSKVAAATRASISATWGSSIAKNLDLTACTAMTTATPPSSTSMNTMWFDDAYPTGGVEIGDASFDTTQAAAGAKSLHFGPPVSVPARSWTVTNAAPLAVAPGDHLVFYALVNPCNPPKQILVEWNDGTNAHRASFGENRIGATNVAMVAAGAVPAGGEWRRIEVLARSIGITATKNLTGMKFSVEDGEVWFDAVGVATCTLAKAAKPAYLPNERIWFDDALPGGAAPQTPYAWDTSQVASGAVADVVGTPGNTAFTQHYFINATETLTLKADDMLVTYVLVDPCNPPREILLEWNDGGWNRRAYWGENLIDYGGMHTVQRRRFGPMPEAGKWVRLEVPVSSMGMTGMTLKGMAFTMYGGRAWFDRIAVASRVNLALGKPATQSSNYQNIAGTEAGLVVDGDLTNWNHTNSDPTGWWEVDLGAVQPIDNIDVWASPHCCPDRMQNFWVLVSDVPFTSKNLATTLAQPGVTSYYYLRTPERPTSFEIKHSGRYVRVQITGHNYLHYSEVQVWAPVTPEAVNLASGAKATQSTTYVNAYAAAMAVNGNSGGDSMSHTNEDTEAWWQVDLGSVQPISMLDIDNAYTSIYWQRMSSFYVFVSDVPFTTNTVAGTLAQPGVSAYYRGGAASAYLYDIRRSGRYVRIQLTGKNWLHPMEVRIWSPSLAIGSRAKTAPEH
ncbi:MAG TPA: carboxypeptidase regulatory-like domain-containing protein [Thermoanaerobaculia bacterium]|nr:carboxypeptidase regulatory-like domain-containing protein [Thermoanaerobaculia bacterium]